MTFTVTYTITVDASSNLMAIKAAKDAITSGQVLGKHIAVKLVEVAK